MTSTTTTTSSSLNLDEITSNTQGASKPALQVDYIHVEPIVTIPPSGGNTLYLQLAPHAQADLRKFGSTWSLGTAWDSLSIRLTPFGPCRYYHIVVDSAYVPDTTPAPTSAEKVLSWASSAKTTVLDPSAAHIHQFPIGADGLSPLISSAPNLGTRPNWIAAIRFERSQAASVTAQDTELFRITVEGRINCYGKPLRI